MFKCVVAVVLVFAFMGVIACPPEAEAASTGGGGLILGTLNSIWFVVTLPIKLVVWTLDQLF